MTAEDWRRTAALAATLAALGALTAGCASAPATDAALTQVTVSGPAAVGVSPSPIYELSTGDELEIRVAEAPQYDQTVKVAPDGKVNLHLVGLLEAAGRTAEDVQGDLRARYRALAGSPDHREYLIHDNDELEFKFPYHAQLNDQMRVRPDGKLQLQMVGTVQAAGLTPEELREELLRRYARYLKDSDLAVIVRTATSQSVRTGQGEGRGGLAGLQPTVSVHSFQMPQIFVTGEVARPGMVAYTSGLTLLQVLAESGGTLPSGDVRKLVILRRADAQTALVLRPALSPHYRVAPTGDFALRPFDVILVPPTRAQQLAETLDSYVYKLIAPLKNSTFGYVYGATKVY